MYLSVIIPSRDHPNTLRRCLTSIKQSHLSEFEVIVVDDCSLKDCSDMVKEFGFKAIRLNEHKGAWYARNKGAETAQGDILVFVDDDMIIQSDTLFRIHRHFSQNHYAAISGVCGLKTDTQKLVTRYKNLWMYYSYIKSPPDSDWFICGLGAVKREVFLELKGFDASFFTRKGGGDLEFGRRLKEAGKQILLDKELLVEHLQRYTWGSLLRNDFKRSRGWFQLAIEKRMISHVIKNLRIANIYPAFIISILASFIFLFTLPFSLFHKAFSILTIFSALAYLIINYPLFRFFWQKEGMFFLLRTIPLCWIDHLISSLGVLTGGIGQLGQLIVKAVSKIGWGVDLRSHYHRIVNSRHYN